MLSTVAHRAISSQVLRGCSRHAPAATVAMTRIISISQSRTLGRNTPCNNRQFSSYPHHFFLPTTTNATKLKKLPQIPPYCQTFHQILNQQYLPNPSFSHRCLASQPIYTDEHALFAKDLSPDEYDKVYQAIYEQHSHPHGPWQKILQYSQSLLRGKAHHDNICILDIGSGPGGPAGYLASNLPQADVISAHTTKKCVDWASDRFYKLGLSNVSPRLVPDSENLDMFADGSFDLVTSCYGLANLKDPVAALKEIHRVLKPGGTFLVSVWENAPADPAADIILRNACAGDFDCPARSKYPMSLAQPHLLENLIEQANLSVVHITNDEYPLKLGTSREFAFKALTLPVQSELRKLSENFHYQHTDAAEAFEDVLDEGFMVKPCNGGGMEVPCNVYKFVAARRQYEDGDAKKGVEELKFHHGLHGSGASTTKSSPVVMKPTDIKEDPVIFDTWIRMKPAASEKIVKAVKKQMAGYNQDSVVKVLDVAPSPQAETAISIASTYPKNASVVVTSRSLKVVEGIREEIAKHGLSNMEAQALDATHLSKFEDKSFDVVVCSFGLTFLSSPTKALDELRRVLKPGGSLIIAVWEDFSLQQLSEFIVNEMQAAGSLQDFAVFENSPKDVLGQLLIHAQPHHLENLIAASKLQLNRIDHETARILLSKADSDSNLGVNVATLPIRPFLKELEKSGENKHAFADAKKAFDSLLRDPSLVSHDDKGNIVTMLPSRFKLAIATRPFEDADGYAVGGSTHASAKKQSRKLFKWDDIPK